MATRKIKSVKGRVMRLTRLDECGNPYAGECATIVTDGFISVTLSDEVEAGEEYTQKNAWGDFCIAEKDGDRVKWANVSISMCEVDPEVLDLVGGANPVVLADDTIGATFGTEPNPNAFALEVWTKKAGTDACASGGNPEWGYFVVPYVRNGILDGDLTIENAPLTVGLKGEGIGASGSWGVGPHGDNPMKAPAGFPEGDLYGMVVTDVQPPEPTDGCQPITGGGPATGATAGIPGTWTPAGSTAPNDAAGATSAGITATPNTAWTTGQYVQGVTSGTAGEMHWSGSAWVAGKA
jgi:hypothetical protein